MTLPEGAEQWIQDRTVPSLLAMKDVEIRYEEYLLDTRPDDLRISWSITKSYLSAFFGIIAAEGFTDSLDDPVTKYAPNLTGTAYYGASVRNVLNMASGVVFDEDYHDFNSDINRMGCVEALGQTLDAFTASFTETFADPGETWRYVSIDTHVVAMIICGAIGKSVTELMAKKIMAPSASSMRPITSPMVPASPSSGRPEHPPFRKNRPARGLP